VPLPERTIGVTHNAAGSKLPVRVGLPPCYADPDLPAHRPEPIMEHRRRAELMPTTMLGRFVMGATPPLPLRDSTETFAASPPLAARQEQAPSSQPAATQPE
jgi:hypothetical protein